MKSKVRSIFFISTIALIFATGSFSSLHAQALYPFPQPGMHLVEIYHADYTDQFYPYNKSFYFDHDTIIGAFTFSKFLFYFPNQNNHQFSPIYTYYINGKVYQDHSFIWNSSFFSNPTSGQLIYDFSLGTGDTISLTNSIWHSGLYTVDSVGSILLANGQLRKFMRLNNGSDTVKWIDAIGDIENGFFCDSDFEGGYEEFICEGDSTGPVYSSPITAYSCDPIQPIGSTGNDSCTIFSYNSTVYPASCSSICNGEIFISNLSGGTPPYSYNWSNGNTTNDNYGLCGGNQTVTITDANGISCSRAFYITVTTLNISISFMQQNCSGFDSICINVYGGSAPYLYDWGNGGPGNHCAVLPPGTYTVCVTDANGCTACIQVNVPVYASPTATANFSDPSCPTCCDGSITINPSGGIPPYTISHPNQTWPLQGNFCNGTYYYCVTDSIGCTYCDSVRLANLLSISEDGTINNFSLHPNPAKDQIEIDFSNEINLGTKIIIYDIIGTEVKAFLIENKFHEAINISDLSDGVYFIGIENGNNMIAVRQRLIISR